MPITTVLPTDGGIFGPGLWIDASTNHIFNDPGSEAWEIEIRKTNEPVFAIFPIQRAGGHLFWQFLKNAPPETFAYGPAWENLKQGEPLDLFIEVQDSGIVIESITVPITWETQAGVGWQLFNQPTTTVQGGFTESDRQLLTKTEQRSTLIGEVGDLVLQQPSGPQPLTLAQLFSRFSLESLLVQELTNGPTGEPLRALVPRWAFGVIVRLTTIPEDLVPKTPDHEWFFPDLAVLRIFRGQDLQYRRGIHEPTFMTETPWQWGWQFLNGNILGQAPPGTQIAVDWRTGCEGQVFIQILP